MKSLNPLRGQASMRFSPFSSSLLIGVMRKDNVHIVVKNVQTLGGVYHTGALSLSTELEVGPHAGRLGPADATLTNLGGYLWT